MKNFKWGYLFAGGCLVMCFLGVVLFAVLVYIGENSPETRVLTKTEIPAEYVEGMEAIGVLDSGENIIFFYSNGFLDFKEGFYLLTDRHVILYSKDWNPPLEKVALPSIVKVDLARETSFFEDSTLFLETDTDNEYWLPLSSEKEGDIRFKERLLKLVEASDQNY